MATPAGSPAAASQSQSLHPMVDVFFSPGAAMDSLARHPHFLAALIIITVIGAATMAVAFERGVIEHGMRQKMEADSRFEQVPAEQRVEIIERSVKYGSYAVVAAAVVGPTIGLLVTSGVLLLLVKLIGGAGVSFRQMMAVVAHAWLPLSVLSLIGIPILLAKDPETIDFQNIVSMSNLSFLFSPTEQHKLYMAATSIDIFSIWVIALLALGIARLTKKGVGTVLSIILIPWALFVVIFKALPG